MTSRTERLLIDGGTTRLWPPGPSEYLPAAIVLSIIKRPQSACHALDSRFQTSSATTARGPVCRITLHGALRSPNLVPWLIFRSLTGQGRTRHITLPLCRVQSQASKAMMTSRDHHNCLSEIMSRPRLPGLSGPRFTWTIDTLQLHRNKSCTHAIA